MLMAALEESHELSRSNGLRKLRTAGDYAGGVGDGGVGGDRCTLPAVYVGRGAVRRADTADARAEHAAVDVWSAGPVVAGDLSSGFGPGALHASAAWRVAVRRLEHGSGADVWAAGNVERNRRYEY